MSKKEENLMVAVNVNRAGSNDVDFLSELKQAGTVFERRSEGQLSVDVGQTTDELVVIATMAGTAPEDIQLHLHNDLLTIRGKRQSPLAADSDHFCQECYWGPFSRTIVLPVDIKSELAQAEYRNGLLIIRLPKAQPNAEIPIVVVED